MTSYTTPGVQFQRVLPVPTLKLRTGVPLFVGLISERTVDLKLNGEFKKLPLPDNGGGLSVIRSSYVRDQILGKTQELRVQRQQAAPDFFLADIPKPDEDVRRTPDDWAAHTHHTERFMLWEEFEKAYRSLFANGYLSEAVRGFFANGYLSGAVGGSFANDNCICRLQMVSYSSRVSALQALQAGLSVVTEADDIDLICVPDIMWLRQNNEIDDADVYEMQNALLEHCQSLGDRFAILDSLPDATVEQAKQQQANLVKSENGALYFPFIGIESKPKDQSSTTTVRYVPACGHIAGVYARTDKKVGVFKAPANEVLNGVIHLQTNLNDVQMGDLNVLNINCLRSFPTRGIRIWGARTLSDQPEWRYVNVRRLFTTAARWIERNMLDETFEPHNADLWARIRRDLSVYFNDLFQRGALRGNTAQEAFYVKCDKENNPKAVSDAGMIITEIGLAAAAPAEFIVVRIIADVTGVTIAEPDK